MSTIGSYTVRKFNENQKFLVKDPSTGTTSLVLGSDLVSYITPSLNAVQAESTRLSAEKEDYDIGTLIQTSGATSPGDNFAATYLVVASGEGDFPMLNGNELLIIRGDELLREQLAQNTSGDGSDLVAHTGTTDTVTQALNKRTIYVGSVAGLIATSAPIDGQVYETVSYRSGWNVLTTKPRGGGQFVWVTDLDKSNHNGGSIIDPDKTLPTNWNTDAEVVSWFTASAPGSTGCFVLITDGEVSLDQFGAFPDYDYDTGSGTDNKRQIIACIGSLGGTQDIASEYIYDPATVMRVPQGNYGVALTGAERFLIDRNNIKIIGAGMFQSQIVHMGTANVAEMFRFKAAYACELSSLTLDGGLPFTPDGTETYGVDVPLTLDQCAHFESIHLNITNYRLRGKQCIHLWESWFDDLRIFNGGFFGTGAVPSAGIAFDDRGQEDFTFPGSESNQIHYGKVAFGTVGTMVKATSPCFNVEFNFVVAEGRTYSVDYTSLGEPKWIIDGITSAFVVHHAWSYHHDQPFNNNATLFSLVNAGPDCKFLNYNVYQEIPSASGNFLEVPNIISNTSAYPVEVNLSINDVADAQTTLFNGASAGTMITGRVDYRSDAARAFSDFAGSLSVEQYFSGAITYIDGAFTTSTPAVYEYKGKRRDFSQIDGSGAFEEFAIRAAASYNGNTDTLNMGKNLTVTKDSVGQYTFSFIQAMPDEFYSVVPGFQLANLNDNIEVTGQSTASFSVAVRDGAGTFHDSGLINVIVVR